MALIERRHNLIPIGDLYDYLDSRIEWDESDLASPMLRGAPTSDLNWRRNIRSVLKRGTDGGALLNPEREMYQWFGDDTKMSWVIRIVLSIESLGGEADYSDIYDEIESNPHRNLTPKWKATVRQRIESHSSDSENFEGRLDLFYSAAGIGEGRWGLRSRSILPKYQREPNRVPPVPRGRRAYDIHPDRIEGGWVYVLHNKSWPGWLKIGKAAELANRMQAYRTCQPSDQFAFEYLVHFESERALTIEQNTHDYLDNLLIDDKENQTRHGEWYHISLDDAIESIRENWIGQFPE